MKECKHEYVPTEQVLAFRVCLKCNRAIKQSIESGDTAPIINKAVAEKSIAISPDSWEKIVEDILLHLDLEGWDATLNTLKSFISSVIETLEQEHNDDLEMRIVDHALQIKQERQRILGLIEEMKVKERNHEDDITVLAVNQALETLKEKLL